jgi:hypothetical protein
MTPLSLEAGSATDPAAESVEQRSPCMISAVFCHLLSFLIVSSKVRRTCDATKLLDRAAAAV